MTTLDGEIEEIGGLLQPDLPSGPIELTMSGHPGRESWEWLADVPTSVLGHILESWGTWGLKWRPQHSA